MATQRGGIGVFLKSNNPKRRKMDGDRRAVSLPRNGIRMHTAVIADVAAAVGFRVRVQNLFVPTFADGAEAIGMTWNRRGVDHKNQGRSIMSFTEISDNAALRIMEIDPFKAFVRIIQLPQGGLVSVEKVQVLH